MGQHHNVGDKPTVKLYIYIYRHAGTPNKTKTKDTGSFDYSSICYIIGSRNGWVSMKKIFKSCHGGCSYDNGKMPGNYIPITVIIGVFAHCAVVFLNVFVLRFLSHRGAETPICTKLPVPVRKLN